MYENQFAISVCSISSHIGFDIIEYINSFNLTRLCLTPVAFSKSVMETLYFLKSSSELFI
ncbi:hypothetical protein LA56_1868 (plasmid) [Francisella philomiragia]|nr:hypothetical protein LA56_1868 [Francisella philomiragia]